MDNDHRMIEWCAAWALIGGTVVCTGCMHGQALSHSSEEFSHDASCKAAGQVPSRPWLQLHEILDSQRG